MKPRYLLAGVTDDGWYFFVDANLEGSEIARRYYAISRARFWGLTLHAESVMSAGMTTTQREMDAWYRSFLESTRSRLAYNREVLPRRERLVCEYQAEVDRCQAELDAARDAYRSLVSMDDFYRLYSEWTSEQRQAQTRLHWASFAMRIPEERLAYIIKLRDAAIAQIADDEQILWRQE